jgi:hypothetical protein
MFRQYKFRKINIWKSLSLLLCNFNFSLDRVLLAGLWTIYMVVAWNVDQSDHKYQCHQLKRKHSKPTCY